MLFNTRLNNRIRVVCEEVPFVRSVSIGIYIKNGSVDENLTNNGISHFIEHMFFKGTPNRSAKKLADEMSRIGGRINAYTAKEYVCFYAHVLDEHLDVVIDILSDMLQNSNFDEADIVKEKGIILEEYAMYEDDPEEVVLDELHAIVWEGHSLGYNIIGTKENIDGMNQEKLHKYLDEHYIGENIVISVVGKVNFDQVVEKLNVSFQKIKPGIATKRTTDIQFNKGLKGFKKEIEQGHLAIANPTINYFSDDTYALNLISVILGGGLNSRLFQSIREDKGLAYSIYSYVETYHSTGLFTTYAATNANQIEKMYEAILTEYKLLVKNGINKAELLETKEQIKSNLIIGMENMSARMSHYGKGELLVGRIRLQDDMLDRINAVNLELVNQLIKDTLDTDQLGVTFASPNIDVFKL